MLKKEKPRITNTQKALTVTISNSNLASCMQSKDVTVLAFQV